MAGRKFDVFVRLVGLCVLSIPTATCVKIGNTVGLFGNVSGHRGAQASPAPSPPFTNPGFESGFTGGGATYQYQTLEGWTCVGPDSGLHYGMVRSNDHTFLQGIGVREGTYAAYLKDKGGLVYCEQSISDHVPDHAYTLTFSAGLRNANSFRNPPSNSILVYVGGQMVFNQTQTDFSQWHDYNITYTASASTLDIRFTCGCGDHCHNGPIDQDCFLDNIGISEGVPTTSAPTTSPTASPTTSPTPAPTTPAVVAAKGDPHLTNLYGQHFDIAQPGVHVFAHVPRGAPPGKALLTIRADVQRVGSACADMYIHALNVTGKWVPRKLGFAVGTSQTGSGWHKVGKVSIKVVHGRTTTGIEYLNLMVKHLELVPFPVGGLMGMDDHTAASTPEKNCKHKSVWL